MVSKMKIQRIKKDVSQVDLWMKTGIPQWRLSLIERGIPPKQGEAQKIAKALGQDAKKLFRIISHHSGETMQKEFANGS